MPPVVFYLHGKSPNSDGVTVEVSNADAIEKLRQTVAEKLSVALSTSISFHKSADADTTPSDLQRLDTIDAILAEGKVAILIGRKIAERDHIVFLDLIKGEVRFLSIDGREGKTLMTGLTSRPDGVQIDERPGKGGIPSLNCQT
ncbi:hypothetical protein C8R44DRAFT_725631 [Mycena epipterygia]|nr:hypothetical protein C8R44DRAFT_725631 [Mycena epipterygia]